MRPGYDPKGDKVERRAVQLGLRGDAIAKYARDWILVIQDVSDFVAEQRGICLMSGTSDQLLTPTENVYPVVDGDVSVRLGISTSTRKTARYRITSFARSPRTRPRRLPARHLRHVMREFSDGVSPSTVACSERAFQRYTPREKTATLFF